ncbi:MAG: heparan-alpha-glucosaminide N-acetyltransferase [Paracoccaceae bacterium]
MAAGTGDRLVLIDVARTVALVGMAVFHLAFDLEMFGHLAPGTTVTGGWAIFARLVAGSFLFLSGVSLVLAHGGAIRWAGVWRRLGRLVAAAALVTGATWLAFPQAFVFFGILHSIALCSLIGLALIRLPGLVLLALAVAVVAVDRSVALEVMNPRWLAWTGLGSVAPLAVDFVPVFPWLGAVLAGMGVAKLAEAAGFRDWAGRVRAGRGLRRLAWPGRHSLLIYLIHQPVLIALVWVGTRIFG